MGLSVWIGKAMRDSIIGFSFIFFFSQAVFALEIQSYPGSTWGELSYDHDDLVGAGSMGFVKQGITWLTLPGEIDFDSYVDGRWRFRSENKEYFNAVSAGLGLELNQEIFSLGVNYRWERFTNDVDSVEKFQFYLKGYYAWNLMGEGEIPLVSRLHILKFPGSTWGEITYDVDGLVGAGSMGFVKQGITWFKFPRDITFDTFADARWRFRSKNEEFYNAISTGLGVEFNHRIFSLGMNYRWERFPNEVAESDKLQFYLRWYYDWDLRGFIES